MYQTDLHFYPEQQSPDCSYIPLGSARGCQQSLEPLAPLKTMRTLSGKLIALKQPYEKYRSVIKCQDLYPLSFGSLWVGTTLKVSCLTPCLTALGRKDEQVLLNREPVKNSVILHTLDGKSQSFQYVSGIENRFPEDGYISYRPWLTMILTHFSTYQDEWDRTLKWQLELEEV